MRMRWAIVAVVVIVAAAFALVVRPPIKDPTTAHQLIAMQRAVDKIGVPVFGPPNGGGPVSFSDLSEALKNKGADLSKIDARNTAQLGRIFDAVGWPTERDVGREAERAALNVVGRSLDAPFKVRALALMDKAGVKHDADYARLVDLVAVNQNLPQTYATQWNCDQNGHVIFTTPLKDPDHIEQLRRNVGLPPFAIFARTFCADGVTTRQNSNGYRIIRRGPGGG